MRVGIDVTALITGRGPARYVSEIVRALARCSESGDEFKLYSPYPTSISGLPRQFAHVWLPKQRLVPWLNWTLPRRARRDRIDVMYFPANDCWWRPVCPTVATLLDVAPYVELKDMYHSPTDRIQAVIKNATLHRAARRVVTISNYSAAAIAAWQPKLAGKITVVPCGVSEAFLAPRAARKPGPPYILFVGGFDRRKNLERLAGAFRLLVAAGRKERLVLAGKRGTSRALYYDIDALVSAGGVAERIDILEPGTDDELARLYAGASLLVLPSLVEGFGLPVLEAMACGCPVACSRAASLPEVAGDAAAYFDPLDVQTMAETMQLVLDDAALRRGMIANGHEQVRHYSWEDAGHRVYSIITDALTRSC